MSARLTERNAAERSVGSTMMLWIAIAVLGYFVVIRVFGGGIITTLPKTIMSNTGSIRHESERGILFLEFVGTKVPRGARVAFVQIDPKGRANNDVALLVATSLLPGRHVVPLSTLSSTDVRSLPEYVASFHGVYADPRYQTFAQTADGAIARRLQ